MSMERIIPEPPARKYQIYGESVALQEPTVDQIIELQKATEGAGSTEKMVAMKHLAISLGMPDKLAGRLRLSDFTSLITDLTGVDKKK